MGRAKTSVLVKCDNEKENITRKPKNQKSCVIVEIIETLPGDQPEWKGMVFTSEEIVRDCPAVDNFADGLLINSVTDIERDSDACDIPMRFRAFSSTDNPESTHTNSSQDANGISLTRVMERQNIDDVCSALLEGLIDEFVKSELVVRVENLIRCWETRRNVKRDEIVECETTTQVHKPCELEGLGDKDSQNDLNLVVASKERASVSSEECRPIPYPCADSNEGMSADTSHESKEHTGTLATTDDTLTQIENAPSESTEITVERNADFNSSIPQGNSKEIRATAVSVSGTHYTAKGPNIIACSELSLPEMTKKVLSNITFHNLTETVSIKNTSSTISLHTTSENIMPSAPVDTVAISNIDSPQSADAALQNSEPEITMSLEPNNIDKGSQEKLGITLTGSTQTDQNTPSHSELVTQNVITSKCELRNMPRRQDELNILTVIKVNSQIIPDSLDQESKKLNPNSGEGNVCKLSTPSAQTVFSYSDSLTGSINGRGIPLVTSSAISDSVTSVTSSKPIYEPITPPPVNAEAPCYDRATRCSNISSHSAFPVLCAELMTGRSRRNSDTEFLRELWQEGSGRLVMPCEQSAVGTMQANMGRLVPPAKQLSKQQGSTKHYGIFDPCIPNGSYSSLPNETYSHVAHNDNAYSEQLNPAPMSYRNTTNDIYRSCNSTPESFYFNQPCQTMQRYSSDNIPRHEAGVGQWRENTDRVYSHINHSTPITPMTVPYSDTQSGFRTSNQVLSTLPNGTGNFARYNSTTVYSKRLEANQEVPDLIHIDQVKQIVENKTETFPSANQSDAQATAIGMILGGHSMSGNPWTSHAVVASSMTSGPSIPFGGKYSKYAIV